MSSTTKKPATENPQHWANKRSQPIDRSKRVAPGCEITPNNVLKGTRDRVNHDYALLNRKVTQYDQDSILDRPWVESHTKDEDSKSKNVHEMRKLDNITNQIQDISIRKKKPIKKDEAKKSQPKEDIEEEVQVKEEKEIPVRNRSAKRRSSRTRIPDSLLSEKIVEQIKRLGGTVGAESDGEYQHSLGHILKVQPWLQSFLTTQWPDNDKVLSNEKAEIFEIKFGAFALPKNEADGAVRQKDAILIGDGDVILAVSQDSALTEDRDVTIQVLDDQGMPESEILLSELLRGMKWEEPTNDENDEDDEDDISASVEL
jgi:hypothetical protein